MAWRLANPTPNLAAPPQGFLTRFSHLAHPETPGRYRSRSCRVLWYQLVFEPLRQHTLLGGTEPARPSLKPP